MSVVVTIAQGGRRAPTQIREIMRHNRPLLLLALVLMFSAVCSVPGMGAGIKYKTSGTFVDGSGGQHPWGINDAHTLLWDSEPYIPVGGVFVAQSLAPGAGDAAYQADVTALENLKAKEVTDIILKGPGPITSADPASLQKIISYLDTNGFTYGLEMDDGPNVPLQGYLVSPNRYRLEGPSEKTSLVCNWPGVDSAIYVIVDKSDNSIVSNGGALVRDGKITISLPGGLKSTDILLVYPHKVLSTSAGAGDLWSGYDDYRDRVLAFFKGIKFGKGMRFFLEPFTSKMDFTGEMAGFLPDSPGFRLGLEAYLARKYKHEGGLNAQWGLNENLDSIEQAARLLPLWMAGRGVPYAYDRANAHLYSINPSYSAPVWQDIISYRDSSAQECMNTIADTLKKQVADVPVIFKTASGSRIYANPFGMGGFDGIGAQVYGTGEYLVDSVAGPAYALAEESGKSTWYIVASTQASADAKTTYSGENAMVGSLDSLREIGCKGFFIDNLTKDPQEIDWLKSFKARLNKSSADFKPEVIYFPVEPATGAYVKKLASNTWWLPTLRRGAVSYIGDGLSIYTILGEGKSYIWSGNGNWTVTLSTGNSGMVSVDYPADIKINPAKKTGMFTLPLTSSPIVLRGLDMSQVFPKETADQEINRLAQLIPEADKAGIDVKQARLALDHAKMVEQNSQAAIAYGIAQEGITQILTAMGADIWLEGENSPAYNFGMPTAVPGASAALAMVLDTNEEAPLVPYAISFRFDTTANSSYEIWVAGTPPAEGSALSYSIDGSAWTPVSPADGKVISYAPGLAWYKVGSINFFPGNHNLTFRADSRRAQDNRYYYAMDAVVLSPRGFTPNGVIKPY